jgi:hypothetical protein
MVGTSGRHQHFAVQKRQEVVRKVPNPFYDYNLEMEDIPDLRFFMTKLFRLHRLSRTSAAV